MTRKENETLLDAARFSLLLVSLTFIKKTFHRKLPLHLDGRSKEKEARWILKVSLQELHRRRRRRRRRLDDRRLDILGYLFSLERAVSTRASWTDLVFLICRHDARTRTNYSTPDSFCLLISRIKSEGLSLSRFDCTRRDATSIRECAIFV